jgi:hypothetical protein
MNNFEAAAAAILPADPVARKRSGGTKRAQGLISDASGEPNVDAEVGAVGAAASQGKVSKGKTGVEFRFYKHKEYNSLTPEQKKELAQWREKNNSMGKSKMSSKSLMNEQATAKLAAAAVKKELANIEKEKANEEQVKQGLTEFILSVVSGKRAKPSQSSSSGAQASGASINKILGRVKFSEDA